MTFVLRPYQQQSIEALYEYFRKSDGNPLLVLPTGAGKSVVQAAFIQRALTEFPGERVLLVSHVRELLQQNADKIRALWPMAPIGIYSAGLRRKELGYAITVAGIQSCFRHAAAMGPISLVIIDECHRVPFRGEGMYRRFLSELRELNPKLKVIGMSATPYRLGKGYLHKGKDRLFTDIAYEAPIPELIRDGYLTRLVSKLGETKPDLTGVHIRQGEYVPSELEEAMNKEKLIEGALDEIERLCNAPYTHRRRWLLFCAGVKHATNVFERLSRRKIPAACVTGNTPSADRDAILSDFKAGKIRALTNVNVLTTGFDAPGIDAVIMLRPTQSAGLYYQMVGRGMRLAPGKESALVLDFAGNIMRHGPIDQIVVGKKKKDGTAPLKPCPECQAAVPIATTECPECGHEFPAATPTPSGPKHTSKATLRPVLSTEQSPLRRVSFDVRRVQYSKHSKSGKPDSLKVHYQCGLRVFYEWVCLEHSGFAGRKAREWWLRRANGRKSAPTTIAEALTAAPRLSQPKSIVVDLSGRYPEVVSHRDLRPPDPDSLKVAL